LNTYTNSACLDRNIKLHPKPQQTVCPTEWRYQRRDHKIFSTGRKNGSCTF